MKHLLLALVLALFTTFPGFGQAAPSPAAAPADVNSIDAIMKAVYDVISGDAGEPRNWDRFRSLFHRDARLIPTGKNQQTGLFGAKASTPNEYIQSAGSYFATNGFHEREIARRVDRYGNIAQVFSTYEAYSSRTEKKPMLRGINSFQLLFDGQRWWVMTIYWQQENPDNIIPTKYLKTVK